MPLPHRIAAVALGCLLPALLPAQAQDMARARKTVTFLASPRLHGRGYVQQGERRAADYLRQRFAALGLQPLALGYFQPFTLDVNTFPGRLRLRVGRQQLRPGADFIAAPGSGPGQLRGQPIQLDTLIFTDEAAGQRFLSAPLEGRIVVLRQRDAERLRTLPDVFAQRVAEAAARIELVPAKLTASLAPEQAEQVQVQVLAARWPATPAPVELAVEARLQPAYPTQNVVGVVRGAVQPDSFVVVTAHYDHLGRMGRRAYFPGANDNASGTALLLELAAHYAQPANRPRYSVAFLAFGAEEAGLVGSRYFVAHPLLPLDRIRFLINLDLEGTGQAGATVVNGKVHEREYQLLERLNAAGGHLPALAPRGRAANSDHYPFSEAGVPAFFLYLRGTPTYYHDVFDRAETLPLSGFAGLFKLVVAYCQRLEHPL
ncbi:M20/M25/M40 family metallo-hydrolase [Hymenobacter sp. 15J16-1T3B]|uniref:M28 family metallopeptidase n=1 Tax=Hymenobacter sp. 15J16-1T3B TaxID=2886941 RepID=UPI001D1117CE|nr:M28 family peptidase [Hymenobacter sp. 15J16-1T3B]MCC3159942.1 M20/M25/M40 family metallo-hydrolase [Hymenobacter sp. 15J16-1T3B]